MVVHVRSKRIRGPSAAASALQDVTFSGFRDPVAALAFYSRGLNDDVRRADGQWGVGFTDGVKSRAFCLRDEDGLAVSDCGRGSANRIVIVPGAFADNVVGLCDWDAWLNTGASRGMRVNWDDKHQAEVTYVLFGGHLEALVGDFDSDAAIGGEWEQDCQFDPDALILIGGRSFGGAAGVTPGMRMSIGFVARGPGDTVQGASAQWYQQDAASAETVFTGAYSDQYKGRRVEGDLSIPNQVELEEAIEIEWIPDGFKAITREVASSEPYAFLALRSTAGERWSAGRVATRTTTGVQSVTFPGWRSEAALALMTAYTGNPDTGFSNDKAARFAIGVANAQGEEYSAAMISDDGASTTSVDSIVDSRFVSLEGVGGGSKVKVDTWTPTDDGWDHTFGVSNPGQAFHGIFLTVESPRLTPAPIEVLLEPQSIEVPRIFAPDPVAVDLAVPAIEVPRIFEPDPVAVELGLPQIEVPRIFEPGAIAVELGLPPIGVARTLRPSPLEVELGLPAIETPRTLNPGPVAVELGLPAPVVAGVVARPPVIQGARLQASLGLVARAAAQLHLSASRQAVLELTLRAQAGLELEARVAAELGISVEARAKLIRAAIVRAQASLGLSAQASARLDFSPQLAADLCLLSCAAARLELAALRQASLERTIRA